MSANPMTPAKKSLTKGRTFVTSFSPTRPSAASMFAHAPRAVSPDFSAAPPMPASIAFWKVAKSILPAEAIADASAAVTPSSSASSCSAGMPASCSWLMTSIWTLFAAATLFQIPPISPIDVPAIVAASAASLSVRVRSWPGLTPAATVDAATPAASPRP